MANENLSSRMRREANDGTELPGDLEIQMGHGRGFDNARCPQIYPVRAYVVEKSHAGAEQHRHELDLNLIHKAGMQTLLGDVRSHYENVLLARRRPG